MFFLWATYPWELSQKVETGAIGAVDAQVQSPERPTTLTILSWNLSWAHGMGSEGTSDYRRMPKEHYERNLERAAEVIQKAAADIVLIQEIDFDSSRSHNTDQLVTLARLSGLKYWARAESWRTQYVPFPYWPLERQFGGVKSGGAVLSRWPITANEVHLLAKPQSKAWWYNLFYLYRYFQQVTIKVGEREIQLVNLHLEAFDQRAKEEQARELVAFAKKHPLDFIGGDFNMLPEGAMKRSGFANPADVYEGDKTYSILRELAQVEVVEHTSYLAQEEKWFTFPSVRPDRRLDYIYHASVYPFIAAEVVQSPHGDVSDHLPLKATFKFFEPEFIRD
jgi:endonuclease/exonuclease/phosphatase family metal-dependent hydrolase